LTAAGHCERIQAVIGCFARHLCLVAEHYPYLHPDFVMPNHELFETHSSKISLHRAKADYCYPTIRLPYKFSKLAGLRTCIYQTVHDGALAFLVVVSSAPTENASKRPESPVFTWPRSLCRNWACSDSRRRTAGSRFPQTPEDALSVFW